MSVTTITSLALTHRWHKHPKGCLITHTCTPFCFILATSETTHKRIPLLPERRTKECHKAPGVLNQSFTVWESNSSLTRELRFCQGTFDPTNLENSCAFWGETVWSTLLTKCTAMQHAHAHTCEHIRKRAKKLQLEWKQKDKEMRKKRETWWNLRRGKEEF